VAKHQRNAGQNISNMSGGNVVGGNAKISGGVHSHSVSGVENSDVAKALEALSLAIRENRAAFEHPADLEDSLEEVRKELDSAEPRPGMLRTLLAGIAAMAPGVGAVADAVLKVKTVVGL
jgi:hypothetical protein